MVRFLLSPLLLVLATVLCPAQTPRLAVDWPTFLGRHDLVWEQLPRQWNEGAFVGNGQLGMMVYATLKDNRIDFHLGRQDVTDHRKAPDRKTSMGVKDASVCGISPAWTSAAWPSARREKSRTARSASTSGMRKSPAPSPPTSVS